jgi:DNA invertase Pin-like site-specific DNA recombinase
MINKTTPNKPLQSKIKPQLIDISKLYTPTGYARRYGCSRAWVYKLIKSGEIEKDNVFYLDGVTLILGRK